MTPEMARDDYEALWNRCEQLTRERDDAYRAIEMWQREVSGRDADLDHADCTRREGGDLRHCRPPNLCWHCRADHAERERDAARLGIEALETIREEMAARWDATKAENLRLRALLADLHEWLSCLSEYEYERTPANQMTLETALARLDAALKEKA